MIKILVTEPDYFDKEAIAIMKKSGKVVSKRFTKEQLESEIADTDVLVLRAEVKADKELLEKAPKLKVIGTATAGLNHIDIEYAKEKGIKIISLDGTHTVPTAEFAFALILNLCRKITWAHESLKRGKWDRKGFFGMQLEGSTIGIIGLGKIGKKVASYAKAFGMKVIYYDPYVTSSELGEKRESLDELLKESDVVTIHAVLNSETKNILSYDQLKLMKKNALLVNTVRGGIMNYDDLLRALQEDLIAGAAIDVFGNEPLENSKDPIVVYAKKNKKLIITPHLGASTRAAMHEAGVEIAENILLESQKW